MCNLWLELQVVVTGPSIVLEIGSLIEFHTRCIDGANRLYTSRADWYEFTHLILHFESMQLCNPILQSIEVARTSTKSCAWTITAASPTSVTCTVWKAQVTVFLLLGIDAPLGSHLSLCAKLKTRRSSKYKSRSICVFARVFADGMIGWICVLLISVCFCGCFGIIALTYLPMWFRNWATRRASPNRLWFVPD